jgi:hypothetical protein
MSNYPDDFCGLPGEGEVSLEAIEEAAAAAIEPWAEGLQAMCEVVLKHVPRAHVQEARGWLVTVLDQIGETIMDAASEHPAAFDVASRYDDTAQAVWVQSLERVLRDAIDNLPDYRRVKLEGRQ